MDASLTRLQERIGSVIKGKDQAVKMTIVTLVAGGNLLIEDVPGVGKTTLASALARATDCSFHRIQFTSDLMPSDITGISIFNPESREFEFKPGPVFANIVLADEINRTGPRTQSALLEAMNEKRITIENSVFRLPDPFMVIATQNPLEYHGTFPLPESQLDRFMIHLTLGYPAPHYEREVVLEKPSFHILEAMEPAVTRQQILEAQVQARAVRVDVSLVDYLLHIVGETRRHEKVRLGVSTRGAQFLLQAAKANAYFEGRDFLVPDDIKSLAPLVFRHRLILKTAKFITDAESVIGEILDRVPVPV